MNSHYLDSVTFFEMLFVFRIDQQWNFISVFMKSDVDFSPRKTLYFFILTYHLGMLCSCRSKLPRR